MGIVAVIFWREVLMLVIILSAAFLVMLIIGAILDKVAEKKCPNDGTVMEYNSYGGYECPKCGRYEKNGTVRFEGEK